MGYFSKVLWVVNAILLKIFFGRLLFPSYIGKPIFIFGARKIFIGRRVRIFPGMRAEVHGNGKLIVHDNVTIGQNLHITCMSELHIHSGTIMSGDVMVTDIDHNYEDISKSVIDQGFSCKRTKIGENCFIGIGVRLQAGTVLGRGCVVGANSVVRGEFPDYSVIVGAPGRIVKRYNRDLGVWERC